MDIKSYLPVLDWGRDYTRAQLSDDALAAMIVTIMLVPQSLAYALLAGLPAQAGLYASMAPIMLYALFGTSRTLAVGPVAVVSLMTAAAVGNLALPGTQDYMLAALTLAFMSGLILIVLGVLRLGFLANFLSHPVIAGFITASGILIAASQLKHILGIDASGQNLPSILTSLFAEISNIDLTTLVIGCAATGFLFWVRQGAVPLLKQLGFSERLATIIGRTGPIFAVALSVLVVWLWQLDQKGVAVVGAVPRGLPELTLPSFSPDIWSSLFVSALVISIIGYVESISVAQTLAAKRRQRINPDQELIGLGAANVGASLTGGFPVTGGFSRSIVNFDSGAATQAAGFFTAIGLGFAALTLTPLIFFLPKAVLAATIIVAVVSLIDFSILGKAWTYSKSDFSAVLITIVLTLVLGVEAGVIAGVVLSVFVHLYKSSRPHYAIVGQVPGCEHYRNVLRHSVKTHDTILSIRVDESLYFANARYLEDVILGEVTKRKEVRHVVLMCCAVNSIDFSALESLEAIMRRLDDLGVRFHLSEVKGPVTDRLRKTDFLDHLTGEVFLSQHEAVTALAGR